MNREDKLKALDLKTIDHLTIVADKANNFKHEVFDQKSPNYLKFDNFQADEDAPQGLIVLVKTTHGFRITLNEGLYMPSMLIKGLDSLVKPFNAPIKPSHRDSMGNLNVEPIGRVVGGQYIHQMPFGNIGFDARAAIQADPDTPEGISLVRQAMLEGPLLDDNFEGLGYVLTKGLVTDQDAIKKILDGRYMTVSVELRTDKWINPVTGNSWLDDIEEGDLDYFIGDMVDGVRAIKVANQIKYDAYAFVTHPADEEAVVVGHKLVKGEEFENIRNRFGSTMMMVDSTVSNDFTDKEVFDSVQGTTPAFNLRGKETIPTSSQGDNLMELKELLDAYKTACIEGKEFDQAKELFGHLQSDQDFEEVLAKTPKSLVVSGLPLVDKEMARNLGTRFAKDSEAEEKVLNRFQALTDVLKEKPTVTDQKTKTCDTNINVGNQNDSTQDEDPSMNKEQILNALSADQELKTAVVADLELVSKSDLDAAVTARDEAQSQSDKLERDVASAKAKRDIYKETAQDSMEEVVELRHSLASATKDHRATVAKFVTLLTALTDKEFDGKDVTLDSQSLEDCLTALEQLTASFNVEDARKSLFDLVAGEPQNKADDPTLTPDAEDSKGAGDDGSQTDDNNDSNTPAYTALEINIAKKWKMFTEDGKIGSAKNLIAKYKRGTQIPQDFNPEQVLESLND
jgi:hypothetical protein